METSLKELEDRLKTAAATNPAARDPEDRFLAVMGEFATSARNQLELIQSMNSKMEKSCADLSTLFCFDAAKYTVEEFFGDLLKFTTEFGKAYEDNVRAREAEEKARLALIAQERAVKEKQNRVQKKFGVELSGGEWSVTFLVFFSKTALSRGCSVTFSNTVLSHGVRSLFGPNRKLSPWGNFSDSGLNQSIKRRLSL